MSELKCCQKCGAFTTCTHKGECCPECDYFDPIDQICMLVQVKKRTKRVEAEESPEIDPETFLFEDDEEEEAELPEDSDSYSTEDLDEDWD